MENGAYTTIAKNTKFDYRHDYAMACRVYNGYTSLNKYGYFSFSTSGIYKSDLETFYSVWVSIANTSFKCIANQITYTDYPILADYNPNPHFELSINSDDRVQFKYSNNENIVEIMSFDQINTDNPIGRVYIKNPTKLDYVFISKVTRRSDGTYYFNDKTSYFLYDKKNMINGREYGYLTPIAPRW